MMFKILFRGQVFGAEVADLARRKGLNFSHVPDDASLFAQLSDADILWITPSCYQAPVAKALCENPQKLKWLPDEQRLRCFHPAWGSLICSAYLRRWSPFTHCCGTWHRATSVSATAISCNSRSAEARPLDFRCTHPFAASVGGSKSLRDWARADRAAACS